MSALLFICAGTTEEFFMAIIGLLHLGIESIIHESDIEKALLIAETRTFDFIVCEEESESLFIKYQAKKLIKNRAGLIIGIL